jgi:hypothetical protein
MRRFGNDDNEEFHEDVDRFFNEDKGRYDELVQEEIELQEAQLDIAHREINNRLFRTAIRLCERSWFWPFYSLNTRLRMVTEAVKRLKRLED